MASLHICDCTKTFGKQTAILKGINLSIADGEFLVLVGGSGCGKSTLLNIIAGLETLTSGSVSINDKDVTELDPKDRDIAMVFQSYALYPSMTVRANIAFGMSLRKVPLAKQDETIARVAKTLHIEALLDRKPAQLSGGQRQRVAMGRALAREPALFLFDEPLSNLDAQLRVEMRAEIKRLHKQLGATIVYVTHDQVEAMTLADKIAVMKDGVIQQFGTPEDIYNNPVNTFVATFMGSPPMNLLAGRLKQTNAGWVFDAGVEIAVPQIFQTYTSDEIAQVTTLGIRPESITDLNRAMTNKNQALTLPIDLIEPTGADTIVNLSLGGQTLIARVHPSAIDRRLTELVVSIDARKIVLFGENGRRV
jgi:multiple sugar transport system ATP-binding protein